MMGKKSRKSKKLLTLVASAILVFSVLTIGANAFVPREEDDITTTTVTDGDELTSEEGVILVPDDYDTIQKAIDNASEGDTIHVETGNYTEALNINVRNLTVQAVDSENNTIDATEENDTAHIATEDNTTYSAHITADDVTFSGFLVSGGESGIVVEDSNNVTVSDTVTEKHKNFGVMVQGLDGTANYNTIENVVARNNTNQHGIAIEYNSSHNQIINSVSYTNGGNGFGINRNTKNNSIRNSEAYNNTLGGLGIFSGPWNQDFGDIDQEEGPKDVIVENNVFRNNTEAGINVKTSTAEYEGVNEGDWGYNHGGNISGTIRGNEIFGNQIGIEIIDANENASITLNVIEGNEIYNNPNGIIVYDVNEEGSEAFSNITINENNLYDNSEFAVLLNSTENLEENLNATYNWWGHQTGPYHEEKNPDGQGDKVTDNVTFNPWLDAIYPDGIPTPPDRVDIDTEDDTTITAGEEIEFTAEAFDRLGASITDNAIDFNWTSIMEVDETENVAIFYEEIAGEYNVSATYEDGNDEAISQNITVTVEDPLLKIDSTEGGNVTEPGEGTFEYPYGTEVNITATADEHWYFDEWTGDVPDGEEDAEEITIIMDEDKTITANFVELDKFNLTIEIEGNGSTIPEEGNYTYYDGENVTVKATPGENWYFVNWTGDYKGTEEEINITMDEDKSITAHFEELDKFNLSIYVEGEGSTNPEEGNHTYYDGENVTIEAIPDDGWRFFGWTGDYPEGEEKEEEINITMDEDKTITVWFVEIPTYELTIEIEGEGEVEVDPEQEKYEEDTEVNLTAIPIEGWYFEEWTGDYESTEEEITIVMDEDKTITAVFKPYEPFFEVEIIAHDRNVKEGEYVRVRFRVTNTGEAEGTQDIIFRVEGLEEDRKEDLTLEVGEEYTGEFFWTAKEGSHLLRVSSDDDAVTVPITVEGPAPATPGFTSLLLILSTVVAVAIYHKKKH